MSKMTKSMIVFLGGTTLAIAAIYFWVNFGNGKTKLVPPNQMRLSKESEETEAADSKRTTSSTIRIPFQLTKSNNLLIKATINKTDSVSLMLHTAVDSISLTTESIKKIKSIDFDQTANVNSWGGTGKARHSSKNHLQIGELDWDQQPIFECMHSGHGSDGKFGLNLFRGKFIEIDFEQSTLLIHDSLPELAGANDPRFQTFDFHVKRESMFLAGSLKVGDANLQQDFMIHSGFSGAILLDDTFVKKNELGKKLETLSESELKDSYGNVIKTRKVRLPELSFGELVFSDVPVGIFDGKVAGQTMSVFGGDLIKRFHWIIDTNKNQIFLRPNEQFNDPFDA